MTATDDSRHAYSDNGWSILAHVNPREYYARLSACVNPRRATPFVGDYQLRSVFETVKTGEWL